MARTQFPAFEVIQDLSERYQEVIEQRGQPVIGWFCSYTPREILVAGGLYPYRILPRPGWSMTQADSYIDRNFCPYVRTCLGEALEGAYKFMDGLIVVNSCDPIRRLYDVWRYNIDGEFVHLLDLPRIDSTNAVTYFYECLQKLVADIETHFKVKIKDTSLADAIISLNISRSRLQELYRVNLAKGMPLSAVDAGVVVRAGTVLPVDTFNGLLERLLEEIDESATAGVEGPRILITGSVMDNPRIFELIEQCGARVVSDDLCTGTRPFRDLVERSSDPLNDLSGHYLGRIPCPRMKNAPRRFDHVLRMIDETHVDGVIFYTLKFCDPFLFDVPLLRERLTKRNLPTLSLEGDYSPGTLGRVRTRIEAFIEMLRQHVRAA